MTVDDHTIMTEDSGSWGCVFG